MSEFFVDPDISVARTLSTGFYKNQDIFASSMQKIFAKTWQFVGDAGLVGGSNNLCPFFLLRGSLDEPLLLTREKEGRISILSNVCTHRGNIIVGSPCKSSHLRCGYHGRLFQLNGKFVSMPEFKEVKNFPGPEDDLARLPLFQWGKWLFTSLDQFLRAEEFFSDMVHRLRWLPVQEFTFRPDLSRDFSVHAHWALYCENYLEGFHIPFVHAGLNEVIDFGNYSTHLYPYSSLQLGIAKEHEDCFDLPADSPDYGKSVAAYYFFIFPNLMFNFYPWGLSINLVQPLGIQDTKISFLTYLWDEKKFGKGAGASLDQVEIEDEQIVEQVQLGIRSTFYRQGRYSVNREQGTHHFHRLISDFMNRN